MYKKHCFTQGLTKVIILLVICDISFCYNFVMKMFVIWPCFWVHTFKTSRLKSLTTSSRVPHYLVQVPRKCIQCYCHPLRIDRASPRCSSSPPRVLLPFVGMIQRNEVPSKSCTHFDMPCMNHNLVRKISSLEYEVRFS